VVIARLSDLSKEITNAQVARIGLEEQVDQIRKTSVPQLPSTLTATAPLPPHRPLNPSWILR